MEIHGIILHLLGLLIMLWKKLPGLWLVAKLWSLHLLLDLQSSLRIKSPPIHRNGVMVLAQASIAISLLIRDGAEANNWNLLDQSLQVHPDQLSGHSVRFLDLVLELNLLKNLLLRCQDGLAGFGSRDSSQIMSMVMILLLIV